MFIINNRWPTQKPPVGTQIDWGHPLAKGIRSFVNINKGCVNAVNNLMCSINSGVGFSPTFKGIGATFSGANDIFVNLGKDFNSEYTFSALVKTPASPNGQIINTDDQGGGERCFRFGVLGTFLQGTVWTSSGAQNLNSFYTVPSNSYLLLTLLAKTDLIQFYVNAIRRLTSTGKGTPIVGLNRYMIGNEWFDQNNPWNGHVIATFSWDRYLSLKEIGQLYTEPYCFLKPIVRRFYSISGQAPTETRLLQKIIIPSNSKIGIRDGVKMVWRY